MFNIIIFLLSESCKSIYRSILPSLISSITIAISLVILSISYFLYMNVHSYTTELKDEYKIDVYFNNEIDLSKALDVFNKILLIDGIENGSFIDKDVAAEIFRKEFDEEIINIVGTNPLPMGGGYGISDNYRTYSQMKNIVSKINSMPDVDEAMFTQESVVKFDKLSRNIISFSFLLGIFIMLISLFFVSNTILLVIYSKKDEIKTLQFLGASRLFIKFPYVIEGFILGVLGTLMSLLILYLIYMLSIYIMEPYLYISDFKHDKNLKKSNSWF